MAALSEFPLVSIVTVNQNNTCATLMFLLEIRKLTYPSVEVWVVDNASIGDDAEVIKEEFPTAHVVKTAYDKGIAGAFNTVIPKVYGKYILLLQNDIVLTPNFIEPLVQRCESNYSIGLICPAVLFSDDQSKVLYAGCSKVSAFSMDYTYDCFKTNFTIEKQFAHETKFGCEYAAMIPFSTMEVCGMLAPAYYSGYDILDWSHRIREAGYSIWVESNSIVYHSSLSLYESPKTAKAYYNRLVYLRRNVRGWNFFVALLFLVAVRFPFGIIYSLLRGNWSNVRKWIKMYRVFWSNLLNVDIHDNAFDYS